MEPDWNFPCRHKIRCIDLVDDDAPVCVDVFNVFDNFDSFADPILIVVAVAAAGALLNAIKTGLIKNLIL
jgi:hypothetical protein